jgi:hypothetical protein
MYGIWSLKKNMRWCSETECRREYFDLKQEVAGGFRELHNDLKRMGDRCGWEDSIKMDLVMLNLEVQ